MKRQLEQLVTLKPVPERFVALLPRIVELKLEPEWVTALSELVMTLKETTVLFDDEMDMLPIPADMLFRLLPDIVLL
jgi:hypothetical protein